MSRRDWDTSVGMGGRGVFAATGVHEASVWGDDPLCELALYLCICLNDF